MTAPSDELVVLARACGILPSYLSHGGERRDASAEALLAVLSSLGHEDAERDPAAALTAQLAIRESSLLEPVVVVGAGQAAAVPIRLPRRAEGLDCRLLLEDGGVVEWRADRQDLELRDDPELEAFGLRRGSLALPVALALGYHQLEVASGRSRALARLLAKPPSGARGRFGDEWRALGVSAPLFSLHSAHSWGCGDFSDLDELGRFVADQRVAVVSTLPLLAGFGTPDFELSPYRPVSRRFWHERWIDVDRAAPAVADAELAGLLDSSRQLARAAASQEPPDAEGALQAKRAALRAIFDRLGDRSQGPAEDFRRFLEGRPEALDFGRFMAAGSSLGRDWGRWPAGMRHGELRVGEVSEEEARFHAFLQWLASEQLTSVAESFERRGQVLSLDLPLGSHPLGYDVWRHQEQYAPRVAVGAPPDRFFPGGQEWGFPPLLPEAARGDGHRQLREALQHHLNVAGLLRIDHILGFERLFWVPQGMSPAEGVYVRSPREELLAVVAIEAQRHRSDIVGEDLGTVDPVVREAMERDGVRRSYAGQLAFVPGPEVLARPPKGSVASFSTHDLPTFLGWWEGRDLIEREELAKSTR